ncbi:uncharacterized protein LOC135493725 [Lineus longissimus]|uniref:uncharacterized protein LOC135493725 n=1 Tax=Lineus longissimus TaxID=88925 RepID=UPI00315C553B
MSSSSNVCTSSVHYAFVFLAAMTVVTSLPVVKSPDDQVARALGSTATSLKLVMQQTEDTFEVFKKTHTFFIPQHDEDMNTHEKYANVLIEEGIHDQYLPNLFQFDIHTGRSSQENIQVLYQTLDTFATEYRVAVAKIRLVECDQLNISEDACPLQCNTEDQKHGMLCKLDNLHQKTREFGQNVEKMMLELSITKQGTNVSIELNVPKIFHLEYYLRVVYQLKTQTVHLHEAMGVVQQL